MSGYGPINSMASSNGRTPLTCLTLIPGAVGGRERITTVQPSRWIILSGALLGGYPAQIRRENHTPGCNNIEGGNCRAHKILGRCPSPAISLASARPTKNKSISWGYSWGPLLQHQLIYPPIHYIPLLFYYSGTIGLVQQRGYACECT